MQPVTKKLFGIGVAVFLIFLFGYALGLAFSAQQILAIIGVFIVLGAAVYILMFHSRRENGMVAAWKCAVKFWNQQHSEDLTHDRAEGTHSYLASEEVYAFVFYRKGGINAGRPCIIVVRVRDAGGLDVKRWEDDPTPEELKNPFSIVETYIHATPVKTPNPAQAYGKDIEVIGPGLRRGKRSGTTVNVGGVGASATPPKEEEGDHS